MAQDAGWLQVSTAGFASLNRDRPREHLVKELVQNALDAVGEGGLVEVVLRHDGSALHIVCSDDGSGITDLSGMRVVYLTHKTDSHLKRGRFGRGFKEILSVASTAVVISGDRAIHFLVEGGVQVTRETAGHAPQRGTRVEMSFDWPESDVVDIPVYFERFLIPEGVQFVLNGRVLPSRAPHSRVEARLKTEVYVPERQSWSKPERTAVVELVGVRPGEVPHLYELGIPIAPADWTMPYHVNVQQRVPMNPNRDAVAPGYFVKLAAALLPTLLSEITPEQARADWVAQAGSKTEAEVQQAIVTKAFGTNAVRHTPAMGKRDFDQDAAELGAQIVHTRQLSPEMAQLVAVHLPSSKVVVVEQLAQESREMAEGRFTLASLSSAARSDPRHAYVDRAGGQENVARCLSFAVWFCQRLVDTLPGPTKAVSGALAIGGPGHHHVRRPFAAHWSDDNQLTLALDTSCLWQRPLGAEALAILVHEAAHATHLHHGKAFQEEVERLAGVAAEVMLVWGEEIRQSWPALYAKTYPGG